MFKDVKNIINDSFEMVSTKVLEESIFTLLLLLAPLRELENLNLNSLGEPRGHF